MSDENLEQRISIKFCVKLGNSGRKRLALLTLAYDEYSMKKSSGFIDVDSSNKGEKLCK
jgi:hypothetical protein